MDSISKAKKLRHYIIDHALHIEYFVSDCLGQILNISPEESKSFGHGSTSFSFNQKVQLIQDLNGIEKEIVQKLTDFMVIRNKFAHVVDIKDFSSFFEAGGFGVQIKKI